MQEIKNSTKESGAENKDDLGLYCRLKGQLVTLGECRTECQLKCKQYKERCGEQ